MQDKLCMIDSFDYLNLLKVSDCRSFIDLKTLTGCWRKKDVSVTNHGCVLWAEHNKIAIRLVIYQAVLDRLAVLNQVT